MVISSFSCIEFQFCHFALPLYYIRSVLPSAFFDVELFFLLTETPRMLATASPLTGVQQTLRSPTPAGAPLILAPRMPNIATSTGLISCPPPPLVSPTDASGAASLIYNPYSDYPYGLAPAASIIEYPNPLDQTAAGMFSFVR